MICPILSFLLFGIISNFFRHAELCAACARVFFQLDITWKNGLFADHFHQRLLSAYADRQSLGAGATACQTRKCLLNNAIFQRVEGDDRDSAARSHMCDRAFDSGDDHVKLCINLYSDCLKASLCGMMSTLSRRARNCILDNIRKLCGAFDRFSLACSYYCRRYLRCKSLLAVLKKYSLENLLGIGIHNGIGVELPSVVHSHIERRIRLV